MPSLPLCSACRCAAAGRTTEADIAPRLTRDRATGLLYAALGVLGYLLNGMGAILGPLQRQLHVDRAQVAFYPSLFALALLAVGLLGGRLVERMGHRAALRAGLCGLAGGAGLLGVPSRFPTLVGAALLGCGGALLVQVVPAALTQLHQALAPAAVGEANAVSSFAAVLAPAAVAAAIAVGADWRIGYLLPVLPVAAALVFLLRRPLSLGRPEADGPTGHDPAGPGLEPGPLPGRWMDVLVAVSVEFCLVFWAADAFRDWHHAGPAAAPALAAAFLVGMAVARAAAARLTTGRHPLTVVVIACGTAGVGFTTFWAVPSTLGAAAGLFVTGLGVALLYPLTLTRVLAAWPHARDRAAARAALASGLAIGIAPLALAGLADSVGLRSAYLIVPALLTVLAAHAATRAAASASGRSA
jgi:MFS family permease